MDDGGVGVGGGGVGGGGGGEVLVMGPQKYDGVAVPKVIILPPASHWRAVEAKDTSCESADMEKGPYSAETDCLYN